jgi:hypothetical protein
MIRTEWAHLCETAFLDDCDRLCMIGVMARFPAPELPIAMRQIMIVVRIAGAEAGESFGIGVSMVTPSGVSLTPKQADAFDIAITSDYVFITLRDVPLAEEGMHRFAVSVGKGSPVSIDVPVRLVPKTAQAGRKPASPNESGFAQSQWVSRRGIN